MPSDRLTVACIADLTLSVVQRGVPVEKKELALDAIERAYELVCRGGWLNSPPMWESCLDLAFAKVGLS